MWTRRHHRNGSLPAGLGWRRVDRWARCGRPTTDQVALAAAGCGFYATLALFPAISMLISVYGLAFDVAVGRAAARGACGTCCRRRPSR